MPDVPSLVGALAGATSKTNQSGSSIIYILLIVGVGFYFFIYRPQQRKQKALRERSNAFEVGDEVVTAGGIVGHVIDIDGDRITLETSVGASFVVLRPYVLRKLEPPVPVVDEADDDSEADDEEPSDADGAAHEEHEEHDSQTEHRKDGHDESSGADGSPAA
jgi:preprotein translocase subunit YajC